MVNKVKEFFNNRIEWFKQLEKAKKIQYISFAVVFVLVFFAILFFATRVKYVVLSRGLSDKKAAEITQKLDELSIPWQSEANLSVIKVPESELNKARINLSLSGISSGDDLEFDDIWNKLSFTQTSAEKNKLFLYEQQMYLTNSLKTLDGIEDARVIINVKPDSDFLNLSDSVARASVSLRLKSGYKLDRDRVSGIVNFVSTAVKGLDPENITIIDQSGIQLNDSQYNSPSGISNRNNELKLSIQKSLDKSLTDFLGIIYGNENVEVRSSVTLNFDSSYIESKQFQPPEGKTEGLVRSANTLKESVSGNGSSGVAGTSSNTTDTPNYPTSDISQQDYKKSQDLLNYEINEINQKIQKAQGEITNISIAVILNKSVLKDGVLSAEDNENLKKLISSASGVDDIKKVEVFISDFFVPQYASLEAPQATFLNIPVSIWLIILAIVVILIVVFIVLKMRKKTSDDTLQEIIEQEQEIEGINTEFEDKSSPKYQIEKFITEHPDLAAQLLRTWIKE